MRSCCANYTLPHPPVWRPPGGAACVLGLVSAFAACLPGSSALSSEAAYQESYSPGPTVVRRLTPDQYRTTIADVFGPMIEIGGRFEPGLRVQGLLALGSGQVSVSSFGMEQYDTMARTIASQVVLDETQRAMMVPCEPRSSNGPDAACARQFLTKVGKLLFRRPLNEEEQQVYVIAAGEAAKIRSDFYDGLSTALEGMLASPQFLFREEFLEPDPDNPGGFRLDAHSTASRLSSFLWNSGPDLLLLEAAEGGELHSEKGLKRQVDRMMASPRLEEGVRAFFSDMLRMDDVETMTKDTTIFPKFSSQVAEDAREQTSKTIVDLLVTRHRDYRELFTTKKTFLTQALSSIYRVPLARSVPNGAPERWEPFEFPADGPRAGIHMHISFVAAHSHPGRSSPTLRGKALREILLCQKVPEPPGDVDFALIQDTSNPEYKTARARLDAHLTEPVCAGCHKITDPIGLALENLNGLGEWQTAENGAPIDTSGAIDGVAFEDGLELGEALHDNPAVTSCLVDRVAAYALGRIPTQGERPWIDELNRAFAEYSYAFPNLMRHVAASPEFYRASQPTDEIKEARNTEE